MERLKNDEIDRREGQIGEMDASQMACMDILKKTMVEIHKAAKETIDRLGEEAADNFYIEIAEGQSKFLKEWVREHPVSRAQQPECEERSRERDERARKLLMEATVEAGLHGAADENWMGDQRWLKY